MVSSWFDGAAAAKACVVVNAEAKAAVVKRQALKRLMLCIFDSSLYYFFVFYSLVSLQVFLICPPYVVIVRKYTVFSAEKKRETILSWLLPFTAIT
jgi:hypothetical protein